MQLDLGSLIGHVDENFSLFASLQHQRPLVGTLQFALPQTSVFKRWTCILFHPFFLYKTFFYKI